MQGQFTVLDWIVLVVYFGGIMSIGFYFWHKSRSTEGFTAAERALPGWLVGLSIFAAYLSSISYLALPGKSFAGDWNPFVFSLAIPIAVWIGIKWFVPYYRKCGDVSAYALLEHRFGPWARIYVGVFYLLTQIARIGVVTYLMALPMQVIFGWDIYTIIIITGVTVIVYAFVGGILAVIWAEAIQAVVLMLGAVVCLVFMLFKMPEGPGQIFTIAAEHHKFSLGSFKLFDISNPTFWVVLVYGIFINLQNFGIDQAYVQRYITAKSDREAKKSLALGGLLYVPVSALFFFIGTTLYAYYTTSPGEIPQVKQIVAKQQLIQQGDKPQYVEVPGQGKELTPDYQAKIEAKMATLDDSNIGDRVFPHFISVHLPPGITGLLIAAIFAAAMSTTATSLNSSATLIMTDYYKRYINRNATEKQSMRALYFGTITWGILGTIMALGLVRLTESALDMWWNLSSIFSGGMVSLFLLGMISRKAGNPAAVTGVIVGALVIAWMVFSKTNLWPAEWDAARSPFHGFMVIVVGTLSIMLVGLIVSRFTKPHQHKPQPQ